MNTMRTLGLLILIALSISACTQAKPDNIENICKIFEQYPEWYWDAREAQKRWGMPIYTQMAIIYQESSFNAKAKPPREKLLWVIPWFRPTSAYGYSQALDNTWENYQKQSGRHGASRDAFADAADFVAWYGYQAHKRTGMASNDAYNQYLAYHEGIGGYEKGTYRDKTWLMNVAKQVSVRSRVYEHQLLGCAGKIPKPHWWRFW